ncbi:MAG: PolC-type DNA polymerase III [Mollicutes bacterium]|nr:PolC-type DNA polymerase III [Mollicutes bacterium]
MDNKLKRFLDKIGYDYGNEFDNVSIEKVIVHKSKKEWDIILDCHNILDYEVFKKLIEKCDEGIPGVNKINLSCSVKNLDHKNLKETIENYFNQALIDTPSLRGLTLADLNFTDNLIKIEVTNKNEYNTLNRLSKKWLKKLEQLGVVDIFIDIEINEDKSRAIKELLKEEKKSAVVKATSKKVVENEVILGRKIRGKTIDIKNIMGPEFNVVVEVFIFGIELINTSKANLKIFTLKLSDKTDSIYGKIFSRDEEEIANLNKKLKQGNWYKIKGNIKDDSFSKDLVLNIDDIETIPSKDIIITDDHEEKRVELHAHTFMSQMDGLISPTSLIETAKNYGHKAIAITDHSCLQSYPDAFKAAHGIKVIYGAELNVYDNEVKMVVNPQDYNLMNDTFVVFDTETTGFNAGGEDQIIEIGAVKIQNGEILEAFNELIDPKRKLPEKITEITGITDAMLKGKRSEQEVVLDFINWYGDLPLIAHNALFDLSFLESAIKKYSLKPFTNTLLDTMEMSRLISPNEARHNLSALVKRYEIDFDEDSHHRADYDATGTAKVYFKMAKIFANQQVKTITDLLNNLENHDTSKFSRTFHLNVLAKNEVGLKNLYRIISLANTKYLYKVPRVPRNVLDKYREGLLIGSSCFNGEVFNEARRKDDEELSNIMSYYDYIEIIPPAQGSYLIDLKEFENEAELINNQKKIIRVAKSLNKPICATGDVHHLTVEDKIYREIIINQNTPNVGRHPLNRSEIREIPSQHFRTTKDMLEQFPYLTPEEKYEYVIKNPNLIADEIEELEITKKDLYPPKMENSDEITKEMVYKKAKNIYGEKLPSIVEERIEAELSGIIQNGYSVLYLIAEKLVRKSEDDGYLVGSRGSVGSSFVATMMGITEVNPLPPHYLCPKCKISIFEIDGKSLGKDYESGYDLPDKKCSCGEMMQKEGQAIPFATFLGFKAEKVPDIDLNFSGDNQADIHDYTKTLFGEDNVFRAGTIGTVADKTAFGFVKGYLENKNITLRVPEIERLANGCVGVKRTTGQHPGGIIVIPSYMDIYDFSPYQYPADDPSNTWYTTHFDFHAIHDNVLKLDILGHVDPTMLKYLEDISGVKIEDVPFDDQNVINMFNSCETIGLTEEQLGYPTATLGLPEFGTNFAIRMLADTRPTTFMEIVKICGLAHGTDVWANNVRDIIVNGIATLKEAHGCRDDIMNTLIKYDLEPSYAFKISEFVRKGMASKRPEDWAEMKKNMEEKNVPAWFIESCGKIKYLFPKAHATAYVMMSYRVAWFKYHYPIEYYSAYFSVRTSDFDVEAMIGGQEAIRRKIEEIKSKRFEASKKEIDVLATLEIAYEMHLRGFNFKNINLKESDSKNFLISEDKKSLLIPFKALDGMGEMVLKKIIEERDKSEFISIEDLQGRGKVNSTTIERLRSLNVLDDLPESSQLSLF